MVLFTAPVGDDVPVGIPTSGPAELGVIKEARRRQRRRRAALAAIIAGSVLAVVVALGRAGSDMRSPASGAPPAFGPATIVAPSEVFAQGPYMGVACPVGNSIACDRVGLAVSLHQPATVRATVDGLALNLDDPTWSSVDRTGSRPVYLYAGFLQPANLTTRMHLIPDSGPSTWLGQHAVSATVWFRIDFGRGVVVVTHQSVLLEPGWG